GASGDNIQTDVNEPVDVIVELETESVLDKVKTASQREKIVKSYVESESYKTLLASQKEIINLISKQFKKADFANSYSYCFVLNGFSLEIPYQYIDELEALPGVKSVHISEQFSQPQSISPDAGDLELDAAGLFTGVNEAQKSGYTGKGTAIAVLDTGFELSHEAFNFEVPEPKLSKSDINIITTFKALNTFIPMWGANYYSQKIPYKWDYAEIDKSVGNENSDHGTHVAGIIGGKSDTITGVAPDCQLLLMKVFGDEENSLAKEYVYLAALDDAVKLGADAVNMSLGSPCGQNPDNIFTLDVIGRLERCGIPVVCSAGNEASLGRNDAISGSETVSADLFDYGTVGSPASYEWCTAVAAVKVNSSTAYGNAAVSVSGQGSADMAEYSSWGVTADLRLKPEITTPGSNIVSSVNGGGYASMSGTSMASPYYAGALAVSLEYLEKTDSSLDKNARANLATNLLMSTAVPFGGVGKSTYYSPRRQGAGLLSLDKALNSKAYLTAADGTSRPKIDLGQDTDGTLELNFCAYNLSSEPLSYDIRTVVLTDSYTYRNGQYINTLTSRKFNEGSGYTLEYTKGVGSDGKVVIPENSKTEISVKITVSSQEREKMKEVFKNGFFIDGFVFLENEESGSPDLSIPYLAFDGDWNKAMLFDNTMYDSEPSYLGKMWGLMVTDGESYYPLGANMFEDGQQYAIDSKYCAYSVNALKSKLKNPTVTVSVGLLRNGKRMDYNLFSQSGVFRFCGSTLLDYCRKTYDPNKSNIGLLWGGGGGLVDGKGYVYKVSTTPANYPGKRTTIEFPFVVDNQAASVESLDYKLENGKPILNVVLHDNRYIMGFSVFDENGDKLGEVSFKDIEPDENGNYTYSLDMSTLGSYAAKCDSLSLYILDYAYNETTASVSLSGNDSDVGLTSQAGFDFSGYSFKQASRVIETSVK
ncbi:MAG: S8 family serine peptidase, partial [Acutalibacteraceae bacterium]